MNNIIPKFQVYEEVEFTQECHKVEAREGVGYVSKIIPITVDEEITGYIYGVVTDLGVGNEVLLKVYETEIKKLEEK